MFKVKSPSGHWVSAKPIPGTILVNIGDLLEMWTGGRFPATKHRLEIRQKENACSVGVSTKALSLSLDILKPCCRFTKFHAG